MVTATKESTVEGLYDLRATEASEYCDARRIDGGDRKMNKNTGRETSILSHTMSTFELSFTQQSAFSEWVQYPCPANWNTFEKADPSTASRIIDALPWHTIPFEERPTPGTKIDTTQQWRIPASRRGVSLYRVPMTAGTLRVLYDCGYLNGNANKHNRLWHGVIATVDAEYAKEAFIYLTENGFGVSDGCNLVIAVMVCDQSPGLIQTIFDLGCVPDKYSWSTALTINPQKYARVFLENGFVPTQENTPYFTIPAYNHQRHLFIRDELGFPLLTLEELCEGRFPIVYDREDFCLMYRLSPEQFTQLTQQDNKTT